MSLNMTDAEKLRDYLTAMIDAKKVLAEKPPEAQPSVEVDLKSWSTSQRNKILAGSGVKAALFGTLSTEPTISEKELTDFDVYPSFAKDFLEEAVKVRTEALALVKVVEP